jgi:competence protein ComEA
MKILQPLIFSILALGLCGPLSQSWAVPHSSLQGIVNVNTATSAELNLLPGIGPAKAAKILAHRQNQPFQSLEDLKKIGGLGAKRLEALRPYVRFIGPTTAKRSSPPETQPAP